MAASGKRQTPTPTPPRSKQVAALEQLPPTSAPHARTQYELVQVGRAVTPLGGAGQSSKFEQGWSPQALALKPTPENGRSSPEHGGDDTTSAAYSSDTSAAAAVPVASDADDDTSASLPRSDLGSTTSYDDTTAMSDDGMCLGEG